MDFDFKPNIMKYIVIVKCRWNEREYVLGPYDHETALGIKEKRTNENNIADIAEIKIIK
jgi:hypothetical protein